MDAADPGLFGPDSVAWRINREAALLAGGSRALLLQLAHPAVAAGVAEHSAFRSDPFARLRRTLAATDALVFGDTPTAAAAAARITAIHRAVQGVVPESGEGYRALDPTLLLWVYATLVDTALRVYEALVAPLSAADGEAYYAEGFHLAAALGIPAQRLPATLAELRTWMVDMIEGETVRVTDTARSLAPAVLYPLPWLPRLAWDAANLVSIWLLPDHIRRGYRIRWSPARERGVVRLAALTRRVLPLLPPTAREIPAARTAWARLAVSGPLRGMPGTRAV